MRYKVKPSKPVALFGAIFGLAVVIVGVTSMHRFTAGVAVWALAGVAIIAFNLWNAFSPRGGLYTVERSRDDDGAARPGR